MCKYCDKILYHEDDDWDQPEEDIIREKIDIKFPNRTFDILNIVCIEYDKEDDNKPKIVYYPFLDNYNEAFMVKSAINYCPMCGRKLTE